MHRQGEMPHPGLSGPLHWSPWAHWEISYVTQGFTVPWGCQTVGSPTLQNGRLRTILSCYQVPDGLTTFLMFLCYKWSYFKNLYAMIARNLLLSRIAQTWTESSDSGWNKDDQHIFMTARLLWNRIILWNTSRFQIFRARKWMLTQFWSMESNNSNKAAGPFLIHVLGKWKWPN